MKVVLCSDTDRLLSEESFSVYSACMYRPVYEDYKAIMEGFLSSPCVKVFVCEKHGDTAGILVLDETEAIPEIAGIAVSEEMRFQGIGKYMIHQVIRNEDLLMVKAQTDEESVGFYRKCGFTDERVVREFPDGLSVRYDCYLSRRTVADT